MKFDQKHQIKGGTRLGSEEKRLGFIAHMRKDNELSCLAAPLQQTSEFCLRAAIFELLHSRIPHQNQAFLIASVLNNLFVLRDCVFKLQSLFFSRIFESAPIFSARKNARV